MVHEPEFKKLPANCFPLKLLSEHGLCIPSERKKWLGTRTNELNNIIRYGSKCDHIPVRKRSEAENPDPDFQLQGEDPWPAAPPLLCRGPRACGMKHSTLSLA